MSEGVWTHLCKLQPAEGAAGSGAQLEAALRRHPGFQRLQPACGQIGGVMLDQVTLELVRVEVEMH